MPHKNARPCRKSAEMEALIDQYPAMSPYVLLKLSMIRYGAVLTQSANERLMQKDLSFNTEEAFGLQYGRGERRYAMPGPVLLRDSSFVYINWGEEYSEPYLIDYDASGRFYLLDDGQVVDEIGFVPRPAFFGKKTSKGTPMETIADVRPQKLVMTTYKKCVFREMDKQCKFCAFFTNGDTGAVEVDPEDAYEVVREALREPGRFSEILLSGGTDLSGAYRFANEEARYIREWQAIGRNFSGRFPSQLMSPAYPKEMLKRIYDNTGITSYSPDLEIADKELFAKYCPGKEKYIGYDNWIKSLMDAVEIFGAGNVYTQVVAGAELAGPDGFDDMERALESNFRVCRMLAEAGVILLGSVWRPHAAADLGFVPMPPLEYFVRLALGLHEIRTSNGLLCRDDDYKHCGDHPDSDLERTDYL